MLSNLVDPGQMVSVLVESVAGQPWVAVILTTAGFEDFGWLPYAIDYTANALYPRQVRSILSIKLSPSAVKALA